MVLYLLTFKKWELCPPYINIAASRTALKNTIVLKCFFYFSVLQEYCIYTIACPLDCRSTPTLHVRKMKKKKEEIILAGAFHGETVLIAHDSSSHEMLLVSPSSLLLFHSTLFSKHSHTHSRAVDRDALFTQPDGVNLRRVFTLPTYTALFWPVTTLPMIS